jgi:WD40 repeat protein
MARFRHGGARAWALGLGLFAGACGTAPAAPPMPPARVVAPRPAARPAPPATGEAPAGKLADDVSWSPSGRFLAAHCFARCEDEAESSPVIVWDLHEGAIHRVVSAPGFATRGGSARFSPDERYIAAAGYDKVLVWRMADGALVVDDGLLATYGRVSFSPDSTRVIWGNVFGTVKLHHLEDGRVLREGQMHPGAASLGVGFSWEATKNTVTIFTEGLEPTSWSASDGADVAAASSRLPRDARWASGELGEPSSADGRVRATAHENGYLAVEADGRRTILRRPARETEGYAQAPNMVMSPDARFIAVADTAGDVELWDVAPAPAGRSSTTSTIATS